MRINTRLLVGTISGLVAGALVGLFMWQTAINAQNQERKLFSRWDNAITRICVTAEDLDVGVRITDEHIITEEWVSAHIPDGAVLEKDESSLIGKRVSASIYKGEPIIEQRMNSKKNDLDSIEPGWSAVTIHTDPVHALGGAVETGMRVSLVSAQPQNKTVVLCANATVLAASNDLPKEDRSEKTASLVSSKAVRQKEITWVTLAIPDPLVSQVIAANNSSTIHLVVSQDGDH